MSGDKSPKTKGTQAAAAPASASTKKNYAVIPDEDTAPVSAKRNYLVTPDQGDKPDADVADASERSKNYVVIPDQDREPAEPRDAEMTTRALEVGRAEVKIKEGMGNAVIAEEFMSFSRANLEAFIDSSEIWAAGMQDLSEQVMAIAQASVEETVGTFRALAEVRSLQDAMELQANLARSTFDKMLFESGRLTDASMKLAERAMAPLNARGTLALERFGKWEGRRFAGDA